MVAQNERNRRLVGRSKTWLKPEINEALSIGHRALRMTRASAVRDKLERLSRLMHENFNRPGVRETIARYFRG